MELDLKSYRYETLEASGVAQYTNDTGHNVNTRNLELIKPFFFITEINTFVWGGKIHLIYTAKSKFKV